LALARQPSAEGRNPFGIGKRHSRRHFSFMPQSLSAVYIHLVFSIAGQEEHHRKIRFQDELRALLRKHEIEWDEKYVWD